MYFGSRSTFWKMFILLGFLSFELREANANNLTDHSSNLSRSETHKFKEGYGKLPLSFEPNPLTGSMQAPPEVRFMARGSGYSLYLTPAEAVFVLKHSDAVKHTNFYKLPDEIPIKQDSKTVVLRLKLLNGNRKAVFEGLNEMEGKSNYFIGNNPDKWRPNVSHYAKVKMGEVYPGIDMVYYGNQRKLEYDFVVKPGADLNLIRLAYEGPGMMRVDEDGDLVLGDDKGVVTFKAPIIYQEVRGEKNPVKGRYALIGANQVGFEIEDYDKTLPLIIDPALDYSTYLTGGSSDEGNSIIIDSSGNAYVSGETESDDFPTSASAYQSSLGIFNAQNVFITKLNATGTALIYSTYLGYGGTDTGAGIALDNLGNVYVTGYMTGTFPSTAGAYQTVFAGSSDGYITKLNSTGSALIYSTYLGGSGTEKCHGIALDASKNVYVTGYTESPNFPTTAGAYQSALGGGFVDAFVTKLNTTGTALVYSTYLGGAGGEFAYAIALDSSGNAYVTGFTSGSFPITGGVYQSGYGGGSDDVFVTKLNTTGTALVYSTYIGGAGTDVAHAIAVDSSGNAYVTGETNAWFPTTAGAYQTSSGGGFEDVFISKLNNTGSALVYSTYIGGTGTEIGYGIAVDPSGNAYVTGEANINYPTTAGAYQPTLAGSNNVFVTELNAAGNSLVYSTYLGGDNSDSGRGIALDSSGNIYVTGWTYSSYFPTTAGAYQTTSASGTLNTDTFVAKFDAADFGATPTNTRTNTQTNTITNTATITSTNTSTKTPTNTVTNTMTSTPTSTPTPCGFPGNTCTFTNTPTNTATNTSTNSATNTYTITATRTPTSTSTNTSTSTATNSATKTVTNTPTSSPTKTSTFTATPSATKTFTLTSTNSPTNTMTKTFTDTATTTPTNTLTSTATLTPTSTPTPCGYPGNTCTLTATPTNTATATVGLDHFLVSKNIFTHSSPVSISVSLNAYFSNFSIKIYNSAGEHIKTIVEKNLTSPIVAVYSWDGTNKSGSRCATGVYVIYIIGAYERKIAKVIFINE